MANNIGVGVNGVVALGNLSSIAALPVTAAQVLIIYQANGVYTSWVPGRGSNTLNSLVEGLGYIIVATEPIDLSAYFAAPIPEGGDMKYYEKTLLATYTSAEDGMTVLPIPALIGASIVQATKVIAPLSPAAYSLDEDTGDVTLNGTTLDAGQTIFVIYTLIATS